jgi:hypothetical protein
MCCRWSANLAIVPFGYSAVASNSLLADLAITTAVVVGGGPTAAPPPAYSIECDARKLRVCFLEIVLWLGVSIFAGAPAAPPVVSAYECGTAARPDTCHGTAAE